MIVITVELKSAISRTRDRVLGVLTIANDGTGGATTGNYRATLAGVRGRVIDTCVVRGFPRKKLLAWDLIYRALRATRGDRNDDHVTGRQRALLDVAREMREVAAGRYVAMSPDAREVVRRWATVLAGEAGVREARDAGHASYVDDVPARFISQPRKPCSKVEHECKNSHLA